MKRSIFLFTLIFIFQCNAQIVKIKDKQELINSSFEKYDFNKLERTNEQFENNNQFSYKIKREEIKDSLKILISGNYSYGAIKYSFHKGWFDIAKEYFPNGNIKKKSILNKTDPNGQYYKEYEFDESGNLVKTTDYDKDYKTSFEQITIIAGKYEKKYGYQAKTGMNDVIEDKLLWNNDYVKIWRKEYKQKKYWLIGFNKPQYKNSDDKKCERLVIVVDDATGKVIKKEHYYDWYNRFLKDIEKLVK